MADILSVLTQEFKLSPKHIENVIALIDEGNTIPFIARYRKELTGSMDDQVLRELSERLTYLRNLEKRREEIKRTISEQEKLTEELEAAIDAAVTLTELEDLYRPYRPKRRTRATIARERGLEPLAEEILRQDKSREELDALAGTYVDEEKGIPDGATAIAGACDIIAEDISDDAAIRESLRELLYREGVLTSRAAKEEDSVYRMYYEFSEPVRKIQSHRILAINRGEQRRIFSRSPSKLRPGGASA